MARKRSDDLETVAHNARLQFVKHELHRGLEFAQTARTERLNGNRSEYEDCKAKAAKAHKDFSAYLAAISSSLTTLEEEELAADLVALRTALDALDLKE